MAYTAFSKASRGKNWEKTTFTVLLLKVDNFGKFTVGEYVVTTRLRLDIVYLHANFSILALTVTEN